MNYRNPKLLAAVRLLPCVNCGALGTQAAHSDLLEHGKGTSLKGNDSAIMGLCAACHHDLGNGNKMNRAQRREMTFICISKTLMQLIERGLIKVA
jgi:cytochrome c553